MPEVPMEIPGTPPGRGAGAGMGCARAAAVLLGLGDDAATLLFRQLAEPELRRVAAGARGLRAQPPAAVPDALRSFVAAMESVGGETLASDHLLREMAARVLGTDAVRRAFDGEAPQPAPEEALGPVSRADPEALALVLAREQPQTIALVLSSLEPARAAEVMDHLPERHRPDVLRRMAAIDAVAPEVLREIGEALTSELKAIVGGGMRKVEGKAVALEILRRCPAQQQSEVIAEIERDSAALAAELRGRLFTFDDLKDLLDRDLQVLLREIDGNRLAVALKGATPELKQKVLSNLSTRAAQMLEDDLAAMGPVKLSTVEAAQGEIAKLALEVAQAGRITIVGAGDTMV